jgi:hypothetical protein
MSRTEERDTAQWTSRCEEYAPASLRVTTEGRKVTFEFVEEGRAEMKIVLSAARTRKLLAQIDDVLETMEAE